MLSPELIRFLRSAEGVSLLSEAASLPADELIRIGHLRKTHQPDRVAAAIELLDLRHRARAKFARADDMFFTREGLEQSTGETAARWRAARFPEGAGILELCCGIGGDAIALAGRGEVSCFDSSPLSAACASANLRVHQVPANVACADVTRLKLKGDAAFFDPSRRRDGRRVRSGEDYSPPLEFTREILANVPNLAVKVSPAISDKTLDALGGRVEFVSHNGECKEAVIWFGDMGPAAARSASIVNTGQTIEARLDVKPPEQSQPLAWLFEPDPAIIRAHLVPEVAELIGGRQLDKNLAYLTGDLPIQSPFGVYYRVIEWLPFNLKRIQDRLRDLKARAVAIKKRGVPFEPEDLSKRLRHCGDFPLVLFTTRVAGNASAILCEPPVT
jgi:hypothetical protein